MRIELPDTPIETATRRLVYTDLKCDIPVAPGVDLDVYLFVDDPFWEGGAKELQYTTDKFFACGPTLGRVYLGHRRLAEPPLRSREDLAVEFLKAILICPVDHRPKTGGSSIAFRVDSAFKYADCVIAKRGK